MLDLFRPLNLANGVAKTIFVKADVDPLLGRLCPVCIKMVHRDGRIVLMDDGERRARHIPAVSADGNYEAARKFGFTGAEVSVESDNGTGFAFFGNGGRHGEIGRASCRERVSSAGG